MGKEFRSEENRAHSRNIEIKSNEVSHFVDSAYPGKVLYVYPCKKDGIIKDYQIYVGRLSEGEAMPINIEVESGEIKTEINKSLSVGINYFDSIEVEKGDLMFIKCRDLMDNQFRAETISINFTVESYA